MIVTEIFNIEQIGIPISFFLNSLNPKFCARYQFSQRIYEGGFELLNIRLQSDLVNGTQSFYH